MMRGDQAAWRAELRYGFAVAQPASVMLVAGLETQTPAEIMAELRAEDPRAAMMPGEFVVLDDVGGRV